MQKRKRARTRPAPRTKRPREVYTMEQVDRVIDACGRRTPCAIRDRAVILVLFRGMLRLAECLSLDVRDVDMETGDCHIRCGKGGYERRVRLAGEVLDAIALWMSARTKAGVPDGGPLFPTLTGERMTTAHYRRRFRQLGERANLGKRFHAHGLRGSGAVMNLKQGVNIGLISIMLGHKHVSTTSLYLTGLSPEEAMEAMARDWRASR